MWRMQWRRRTKEPAFNIAFFGCNNSRWARAARRFLPPAPRARSGRLNVTEARTTGRPKRTRAHLHAMEPTWPAGVRRGARGCVLRLSCPPLAQTRRRALRIVSMVKSLSSSAPSTTRSSTDCATYEHCHFGHFWPAISEPGWTRREKCPTWGLA